MFNTFIHWRPRFAWHHFKQFIICHTILSPEWLLTEFGYSTYFCWNLYSGAAEKMAVALPQHPRVQIMTASIQYNKQHSDINYANAAFVLTGKGKKVWTFGKKLVWLIMSTIFTDYFSKVNSLLHVSRQQLSNIITFNLHTWLGGSSWPHLGQVCRSSQSSQSWVGKKFTGRKHCVTHSCFMD